ncbi:5-hydroxytryptamine receptor 3A-like [Chelmon rostratus]|uniref:5-hydroxytryptamine receptor 3A-like n=1 Tax=Chelmon rostratus TaxID=109905 RepID=UPI001BE8DD4B|nr:5-hydroxytryptamine receptor 3A-like [Chelmon rostratus]
MMLAAFLLLLLFTGGSTSGNSEQSELLDDQQMSQKSNQTKYEENSESNCSYQALFKYLNLTKNNDLYTMVRPVKHYNVTTLIHLKMVIYAILDVREIDQSLVLYVWIYMSWRNYHIWWDPDDFCGLNHVLFPAEVLWKPDLSIEEMTEKDKAPPSPYLSVTNDGLVESRNDEVVISTCRMQVYKFPFDTQICTLSFKSALHSDEIKFKVLLNTSKITEWSREVMRTQYEWLFLNMTVTKKTVDTFGYEQSMVVYTISMKRRSVLYIVNFLLPVLFFLCLDLASFLISETSGEKLGFKVTVLLAVTVMQLILNEILPASSDRIPLIALYCIGSFALMMLSLLETILVMHLMDKDNQAEDQSWSEDCGDKQGKVSFYRCFRDKKKWTNCGCVCDMSAGEAPPEPLSVAKEGSDSQLTEESSALEKVTCELRKMEKTLSLVLDSRTEGRKPGYWTRVAKTINKFFFIFYVAVASRITRAYS